MKNIDVNEVYTLFEEIKGLIKKGSNNTPTVVQPEIEMPDLSAINELTNRLNETIEAARKPVKMEHRHVFSFASNKVTIGVIGLCIICIACIFTIHYQREMIGSHKDNDLKYRYVKMQGKATPGSMYNLENIFDGKRDSVKVIRKQVEKYEKAIMEEAIRLEKARLKEQEAERLQEEAAKLKQGK